MDVTCIPGMPGVVDLGETCIHLAPGGAAHAGAAGAVGLARGHVLAVRGVRTPQDVHYPDWEMHPEGDEILAVASGAVSVAFRDGAGERMARLPAQSAVIVPAGIWHRLVVHEPSVLIAVTPRRGTRREAGQVGDPPT